MRRHGPPAAAAVHRPRARGDAAAAAGAPHLSLEIERSDQDLSGPPVPARLRAGRAVSARVRAGVRRGADVRGRAHPGRRRCSRSASRRSRSCPTRRFRIRSASTRGRPEHVEIEFEPAVADYVRAREWHPSQQLRERRSGGVALTLDVCLDRALHSWILSFGPFARVIAPAALGARDRRTVRGSTSEVRIMTQLPGHSSRRKRHEKTIYSLRSSWLRGRSGVLVCVLCAVAGIASAATTAIQAGTRRRCVRQVITNAVIVVDNDRIVSVGTGAPPAGAEVIDLSRYTLDPRADRSPHAHDLLLGPARPARGRSASRAGRPASRRCSRRRTRGARSKPA